MGLRGRTREVTLFFALATSGVAASISGSVVDAVTGRPLQGAKVSVYRADPLDPVYRWGPVPVWVVETDPQGHFRVDVDNNLNTLSAERRGYQSQNYGGRALNAQGLEIAMGKGDVKDLAIRLIPDAVITGRVR